MENEREAHRLTDEAAGVGELRADADVTDIDERPVNHNLIYNNPEKWRIGREILERYTGAAPEAFQKQVLLTNFQYYLDRFEGMSDDVVTTTGSAMTARHSRKLGVSIINFSVGSPRSEEHTSEIQSREKIE